MKILVANHSSYPRIDEGREWQQLRADCEAWQRGDKTADDFEACRDRFVQKALADQEEAGCDLVTDGLIRWHDPISHPAGALTGVNITGLLRYFDTNTYFRQPRVTGKVSRAKPIIAGEVKYALSRAKKPLKAVLTGPLTLAGLSLMDKGTYRNAGELAVAYAEALAEETAELDQTALSALQFDEPLAVRQPQEARHLAALYRPILAAAKKLPLHLAVYFGDATALMTPLEDCGFSWLGLDVTYSPNLLSTLAKRGSPRNLALGIADARNTRLEKAEDWIKKLKEIMPRLSGRELLLTPSCGLEFLPRGKARAKLAILARIKAGLAG